MPAPSAPHPPAPRSAGRGVSLLACDASRASRLAGELVGRQDEVIVFPVRDAVASPARDDESPGRCVFWTAALASAAAEARRVGADAIVLPLVAAPADPNAPRLAEWLMVARDLLHNAFDLPDVRLEAPVFDFDARQLDDLATRLGVA